MKQLLHWLLNTSHETILEENYMGSKWSRLKCVICGKITNAWEEKNMSDRSIDENLINIGIDDFGVSALVQSLTLEQLNKLRQMIIVAAYIAEDMWRREQDRKNPASSEKVSKD